MIGESPSLPGIFHACPEVVVAPDISPFALTTEMWMVPVVGHNTCSTAKARLCSGMPRSLAIPISCRERARITSAHSGPGWRGIALWFKVGGGLGSFHCGLDNGGPQKL